MLLDIGSNRVDDVALNPLPAKPAGFSERFQLEHDAFLATEQFWSEHRNVYDAYERAIEDVAKVSGQRLTNPYAVPDAPATDLPFSEQYNPDGKTRAQALAELEKVLNTLRADHPELPDPGSIVANAEKGAAAKRQTADERGQVSLGYGDVGAFTGMMWGAVTDPVNLATMPIGGTARISGSLATRMIKQFGVEALIGAVTQAGIEVGTAEYKDRIGVESNPVLNILAAGLGAGVLGASGRGLIDGFRLLRNKGMTLDEIDALRVADRAIGDADANPYPVEQAALHEANLNHAEASVAKGLHPEVQQPVTAPRLNLEDTPQASGRVFTASGRAVDTELQVVEGATLVTSNTGDMQRNPLFPAELQPRDRNRAAAETQVQEIAANLEPERLGASPDAATGAPIVGPDGIVESGNGRTLAILRAYQNDGAPGYRAYLKAQGFNADGMANPVLVRRRTTQLSPEDRVAFTREANAASTLSMSAAEQALADAAAINRIVDLYEGGDVTLAGNRKFVNAFIKGLPSGDRGAMTTADGALSMAGRRRVEGGLLAAAYGDEAPGLIGKLLESTDNDIKAIGGALQDVAARWAALRKAAAAGDIAPTMDITADLIAAVRVVEKARSEKHKVADLVAQGDLLNEGMGDNTKALLASFFRDFNYQRAAGRKSIADRLLGYLDEAEKSRPGQDIFGEGPPSASAVLRATDPRAGQLNLLAENARASGDALENMDGDTAAFVDAQRLAAERNPTVDTPDGQRAAADLLDEAEDDERVAKEIASACVAGVAAE